MRTTELVGDAFGRVAEEVPSLLEGLSSRDLEHRPAPDANPIGWLVWHLARVQDDHMCGVARALFDDERPQVLLDGWSQRLGLPYPDEAIGYGMSHEDVGRFHVADPQAIVGYHAAVHARTLEVLDAVGSAGDEAWDRIVDEQWDPPVTAGARVVSVVNDITQHLGQAAYVRGMLGR